jgi:hypothetical protein
VGGQRLSLSQASLQQVPREKRECTGFGNVMLDAKVSRDFAGHDLTEMTF